MGSLFSTTQKTSNKSTESGTANTANNLWNAPGVQDFYQQYVQQYSPGNIASVQAPVNSYQTGAVGNQQNLAPVASDIANNGITQSSIRQYLDPYIQSVVDPTKALFNQQNQQALSNLNGNSALKGALGNNTGQGAAYLAGVVPGQGAQLGALYSQGFNQAGQLANQSGQLQLQGVNQGTAANQGQFNMGETIRQANLQNQLTPYSLQSQGIEGYTGLGGLAGTNTATSGTSTGSSSGTSSPGAGTVGLGILGALASFSDERVKDNIKPIGETYDGQPIYKYNLKGSPKTEIGLMAQDVEQRDPSSVGSFGGIKTVDYDRATKGAERANGGGVDGEDGFHGKVMKAFHMIQGMKEHARGGAVRRGMGGDVGLGSWAPVVTSAPDSDDPTTAQKIGGALTDFSKKMSQAPQGDGGLGQQQAQLHQMLQGMSRPMRPYGGAVDDYSGIAGWPNSPSGPTKDHAGPDPLGLLRRWMGAVKQGTPAPAMSRFEQTGQDTPDIEHMSVDQLPQGGAASMDYPGNPGMIQPFHSAVATTDSLLPRERDPNYVEPSLERSAEVVPSSGEVLPWNLGASDVPPPTARPTASVAPPAESSGWSSDWHDYLPTYSTGVWAGEQATPLQRLGLALTQVGGKENPFYGFGQAGMGYPKGAAETSKLQSEALSAAHDANLEYQLEVARKTGDVKREQELKRFQMLKGLAHGSGSRLDQLLRMTEPQAFQGDDGNWYKPDPSNPGKYLMAQPKEASP